MYASRAIEEHEDALVKSKEVAVRFSAKGHELGQILLGSLLAGLWRSRGKLVHSVPLSSL